MVSSERTPLDLAIVGAGPIGIEAAIRARRAGLAPVLFDKGPVVNAIVRYPTYMTFFTTSERLEVGGHPLVCATDKPTRKEALDYYRKVVHAEGLDVRTFTAVASVTPRPDGAFDLETVDERGVERRHVAAAVMIATGYFEHPKRLGVEGEDLPHVSHYFDEPHRHYGRDVVIVGAGSSAADAALELHRAGARVRMLHRGDGFRHSLKYWIRPNLENRVKEGSIVAHFRTTVLAIGADHVLAERRHPDAAPEQLRLSADRVFLLTGYYADPTLLHGAGVRTDPLTLAAALDPESFETDVPGLYCIGSAGFGTRTSDVFIENGLVHAAKAVEHLLRARRGGTEALAG